MKKATVAVNEPSYCHSVVF